MKFRNFLPTSPSLPGTQNFDPISYDRRKTIIMGSTNKCARSHLFFDFDVLYGTLTTKEDALWRHSWRIWGTIPGMSLDLELARGNNLGI